MTSCSSEMKCSKHDDDDIVMICISEDCDHPFVCSSCIDEAIHEGHVQISYKGFTKYLKDRTEFKGQIQEYLVGFEQVPIELSRNSKELK